MLFNFENADVLRSIKCQYPSNYRQYMIKVISLTLYCFTSWLLYTCIMKSLVAKGVRSTLDHSEKIKFLLFLPYSNTVINRFFLAIFFSLFDGNFNFSLVSSYRATKNQYIKTKKKIKFDEKLF